MKNYQKAVRYASKLIRDYNAPYNPRDLVHDSFLSWSNYKNSNLFDQKEGTIMKTIKNKYFNILEKEETVIKGNVINKQYIRLDDDSKNGNLSESSVENEKFIPRNELNPELLLINKDIENNINSSFSEFDKKVLDLKLEGYQNKEIEKILDTHNVKITSSIKNIKKIMHTKSPFAGSKLDIVKRIKRSEFEKNKEEYLKDWEMGEDSDYNESFVQMTSKTNPKEGLLIKEKNSD